MFEFFWAFWTLILPVVSMGWFLILIFETKTFYKPLLPILFLFPLMFGALSDNVVFRFISAVLIWLSPVLSYLFYRQINMSAKHEEIRIDNVKRVFMRSYGWYTLLIENPSNKELERESFNTEVKIVADVQPDRPMWAVAKKRTRFFLEVDYPYLEVHVHSGKDVEGAG